MENLLGLRRPLPPVGTSLIGKTRGKQYEAEIVEASGFTENRAVRLNNRLYDSMTAAAREVCGYSVNGWKFWTIK